LENDIFSNGLDSIIFSNFNKVIYSVHDLIVGTKNEHEVAFGQTQNSNFVDSTDTSCSNVVSPQNGLTKVISKLIESLEFVSRLL